eukprot:GEMP01051061.1.p1 GENE.GEMP01051061.1~~GEMP01051061.1.p1  ORF type:complete len:125 (+),score=0.12 GEMP01051061.1:984-1358(+)
MSAGNDFSSYICFFLFCGLRITEYKVRYLWWAIAGHREIFLLADLSPPPVAPTASHHGVQKTAKKIVFTYRECVSCPKRNYIQYVHKKNIFFLQCKVLSSNCSFMLGHRRYLPVKFDTYGEGAH